MNLRDLLERLEDKNINLIPNLKDRNINNEKLNKYCNQHPYFEKTVRHMVSLFRYISFEQLMRSLKYLSSHKFLDLMLNDLKQGYVYVFVAFGDGRSGHYFTLLFLQILSEVLDPSVYDKIIVTKFNPFETGSVPHIPNAKYITVDDASYSGDQLTVHINEYQRVLGAPCDFTVIITAMSSRAKPLLDRCPSIMRLFVGRTYTTTFNFTKRDLYYEWDVIYETNGHLYSLLNAQNEGSNFYFQHKYPDSLSVPDWLISLPDPDHVDKVLTLDEKKMLDEKMHFDFKRNYAYFLNSDRPYYDSLEMKSINLIPCDNKSQVSTYGFTQEECYKPFYKDDYYWKGILD